MTQRDLFSSDMIPERLVLEYHDLAPQLEDGILLHVRLAALDGDLTTIGTVSYVGAAQDLVTGHCSDIVAAWRWGTIKEVMGWPLWAARDCRRYLKAVGPVGRSKA